MLINAIHHLTYCTNIHPGQNWQSTFDSLKQYVPGIKNSVSKEAPFGLGLRLSNKASEELNQGNHFSEFKEWLQEHDIYVFTMNGFPYGNFHDERVKDKVHAPDWTTRERVEYTKRLFVQLEELLPGGIDGGISTSPITYKYWHQGKETLDRVFTLAAEHFTEIALQLFQIEKETGKYLHLDIEPEPDGLLENSDEVVQFYRDFLIPIGIKILHKHLGLPSTKAEEVLKRHITVCYDICHFSLAYEEPEDTFKKFAQENIRIGKIQVSAALKILFDKNNKDDIWKSLSRFNEPTYLHQVTEKIDDQVKTYNDLPIVLEKRQEFSELRAHFHVPIFLKEFGQLYSTQDHILKVMKYLKSNTVSNHLEIETYTWDVLPKELKKDLIESIVREINWLKAIL